MSLKIKILRESIRSFSYLQDVLTWSNSLDDTTCTDSQSWTSWRCSGYTTHCLSFIVVSKIFLMVKSTQLCGEKQREDVNLVTPDTRQCDCLCSRARAPRAFFFLHQSKHHLASQSVELIVCKFLGNFRSFPEFALAACTMSIVKRIPWLKLVQ